MIIKLFITSALLLIARKIVLCYNDHIIYKGRENEEGRDDTADFFGYGWDSAG